MTEEKKSQPDAGQTQPDPARAARNASRSVRKGFPTAVDLLVFLGIFLVANLLGTLVALAAGCSFPDMAALASDDAALREAAQTATGAFNAVNYLVTISSTLAAYLLYRRRRGGPRGVGRFSMRGMNPVLLVWGILLMFAVSVVLEPLLSLLPQVPNVYGRGIWAFLTLAVMAPLFEEVLFRGVLLESMRPRYGVVVAWVLSSVLFGVVHVHPTVVVNAFFMGLVLGFIYLVSGSLWASIILHAVNNAAAYLLLVSGHEETMVLELVGSRTWYVLLYVAALAVAAVSARMIWRTLARLKEAEKNAQGA